MGLFRGDKLLLEVSDAIRYYVKTGLIYPAIVSPQKRKALFSPAATLVLQNIKNGELRSHNRHVAKTHRHMATKKTNPFLWPCAKKPGTVTLGGCPGFFIFL